MQHTTKARTRKPRPSFLKLYTGFARNAINSIVDGPRPFESLRVLMYFLCYSEYSNIIDYGTQQDLAKLLGVKQANVSRAFTNLHRAGILIKYNGKYRLDKRFAWIGDNRLTTAQIMAWNLHNQKEGNK
jgi:hypothetical protein